MPTYQYVCIDCDSDLEAVQSFTEPSLTDCPTCGGKLRKRFGAVGVVFKGSGFYRNDSRSEARAASERKSDGVEKSSTGDKADKADAGAKIDKSDQGVKGVPAEKADKGVKTETNAPSAAAKSGGESTPAPSGSGSGSGSSGSSSGSRRGPKASNAA